MYFLGIDGGGTKTKFVLINEKLEISSVFESTTTHIFQVGTEGIINTLRDGLNLVLDQTQISKEDICYVVLGMPGYSEVKKNDIEIEEAVKEVFYFTDYYIVNDSEIGWAGALACQPGISIVAGTGSIGFAVDSVGNKKRTGGWGDFIGDEGSAHWIAKKVLEIYSKQKDGRIAPSVLLETLERNYDITEDYELIDIIHNRFKLDRSKIAKFSLCAFEAANKGCPYSIKIFKDSAYELYLHVKALIEKTEFTGKIPVSYVGGVFNAGAFILEPLKNLLCDLNRNIEMVKPYMEPCFGAAFYAYILYKKDEPNTEAINTLLGEIKKYEQRSN